MAIGRNIAKVRKQKGLTQEELATMVGIRREYLADIEIRKETASIRTLARIAENLNVTIEDLIKGE